MESPVYPGMMSHSRLSLYKPGRFPTLLSSLSSFNFYLHPHTNQIVFWKNLLHSLLNILP